MKTLVIYSQRQILTTPQFSVHGSDKKVIRRRKKNRLKQRDIREAHCYMENPSPVREDVLQQTHCCSMSLPLSLFSGDEKY